MRRDDLWWKLSVEGPCAVTDWLYANMIVALRARMAELLTELTLRKLIYAAAFFFAAIAFSQLAAGEILLLMAGDLALYVEIVSLFYLTAARNHLASTVTLVRQKLHRLLRRATRRARRMQRPRLPTREDSGDVPDGAVFA